MTFLNIYIIIYIEKQEKGENKMFDYEIEKLRENIDKLTEQYFSNKIDCLEYYGELKSLMIDSRNDISDKADRIKEGEE